MNYTEQAITFRCGLEKLVGILTVPQTPASVGVVVVVGGPQYRAGSHRQFVLLTRALAKAGVAALRFDYRGMGDSSGALHDFRDVSNDIGAAIDALQQQLPPVSHVALWGLCDGASAALLYCNDTHDDRVRGLCMLNPWVRSEASLARTHVKHYYLQRLRERTFWAKVASGRLAWSALAAFATNVRLALTRKSHTTQGGQLPFQDCMAVAWKSFDRPILLWLSGRDLTAQEFLDYATSKPAWQGALTMGNVTQHREPHADHTLSAPQHAEAVAKCTLALLKRITHKY